MRRQRRARRPVRGVALILVMMVAAVFLILMGTLIDVLAIESQNAIESADAEAALTAAYSGVDVLILQTEEYYQNSVQIGQPPQSADCSFKEPGGGSDTTTSCTATLLRTWNGNGLNYYLIESTGEESPSGTASPTDPQRVSRTVDALVKEIPFGAYAMFSETETPNKGNAVWYSTGQSYSGPVYSGGAMHVRYDSSSQTPIFPNGFTSSAPASSIHWYNIATGLNRAPSTPAELFSVYGASGQPNFPSSSQSLPGLAQNLVVFSEAYYGDTTHDDSKYLPTGNNGVFVNQGASGCGSSICTGIFVQGDAQLTATSVASPQGDLSSGTQTWKFDPPLGDSNPIPGTVTITVDFGRNTTTVIDASAGTKVYSGVASGESEQGSNGNGAIFVNGSLSVNDGGTVHGQYTVAVPDPSQNSESMTLKGSLQYASDPRNGPSQDELALWADKIWLNSLNNNPIIDGMILTGFAGECSDSRTCGGYFANPNCTAGSCSGGGVGTLSLYGSIIENMRGKMGVVGPDGNPMGGFLRTASYDARLGANPPPFSPTTNLYSIIALSDHGVTQFLP